MNVEYLLEIECPNGHRTTYVHEAPWVPADQEIPTWPDVYQCPDCGHPYDGDLGAAITEDAIVKRVKNPEDPPDEHVII